MSLPDTLLVDGTDLASLTGVSYPFGALDGLLCPMLRRGSNQPKPGIDGEPGFPKPLAAFSIPIPFTIVPNTENLGIQAARAQTLTNYAALIAAVQGDQGQVTLTRRLCTTSSYIDVTAPGEFTGASNPLWPDLSTLLVTLTFVNLNGYWLSGSTRVTP